MSAELPYEIEPELRLEMPRPARIKKQKWIVLGWLVGIGFIVALVIGWFAVHDLNDLYTLRTRGVTAQAVITAKRKVHGKSYTYYFAYYLHTVDTTIIDEDVVTATLYQEKDEGDKILVTYLPGHNQTHRIGAVDDSLVQYHSLGWGLGMLFGIGLFGLLFVLIRIDYVTELRLARDGVPTPGTIRECVAPVPNARVTDYTICYRFEPPFGEQIRTYSVSSNVGKHLAAGQTVTVLYDAADPRRSCLYCALRYTEIVPNATS